MGQSASTGSAATDRSASTGWSTTTGRSGFHRWSGFSEENPSRTGNTLRELDGPASGRELHENLGTSDEELCDIFRTELRVNIKVSFEGLTLMSKSAERLWARFQGSFIECPGRNSRLCSVRSSGDHC
ncbi:hypothetical protein Nepgr_011473 [Nepenthes gracilis]|uniref:Uncharacterized protein n=1 Tax=Nepenthes gracilis TaxID=150966 RepID=A0AAD3SFI7_NEPGR|nr:hypothetical protein Nepgr_011473 [Nepenthes gracilis]